MKKFLTSILGLSVLVAASAVETENRCSTPVIVSSSGQQTLSGVSVITITADAGDMISYTVDGSSPSTDLADASASPVTFTVGRTGAFSIKAVALSPSKEASDIADYEIYDSYKADRNSILEFKKNRGEELILAGPLTITAVGMVAKGTGKGSYWMFIQDKDLNALAVSNNAVYLQYFSAGMTVDFLELSYEENYAFTICTYERVCQPEASYDDGGTTYEDATGQDAAWQQARYGHPVVFRDVKVESGLVGGLVVYDKFEGDSHSFEEGVSYDIYGIIGSEDSSSGTFDCLYVLDASESVAEPVGAGSIAEAFDLAEGSEVSFTCGLTVIAVNRAADRMFVTDDSGDCLTVDGDFTTATYRPGDILCGLTITTAVSGGVRIGLVASGTTVEVAGSGAVPEAREIDVADLADNVGNHVSFTCSIDKVESGDTGVAEISVGGVHVDASAISEEVAASVTRAVDNYQAGSSFSMTGIVTVDQDGNTVFWPTAIVDSRGNDPTTGVDAILRDGIITTSGGRVVLPANAILVDPSGRRVDPSTAPAGIYILSLPAEPSVKILLK